MKRMRIKSIYCVALGAMLLLTAEASAMKLVAGLFKQGLKAGQGALGAVDWSQAADKIGNGRQKVFLTLLSLSEINMMRLLKLESDALSRIIKISLIDWRTK
jgi:hypothetical protein